MYEIYDLHLPISSMWSCDEIRFLDRNIQLNEFGIFYIGLFIIGNYARYYPDMWIKEVEEYSPLAAACEQFMRFAEWRMALITLSDLSSTYMVREI
jgi:hypothetical protein